MRRQVNGVIDPRVVPFRALRKVQVNIGAAYSQEGRQIAGEKARASADAFWAPKHELNLSVDRLDRASDEAMTSIADAIAKGRGAGRSFYSWAVVALEHAERMGRTVSASPRQSRANSLLTKGSGKWSALSYRARR